LLAVPILIQVYFNSGLAYILNRTFGVAHCVAAPSALIGASNFFELAVATAIVLFGFESGAALATVVGVLARWSKSSIRARPGTNADRRRVRQHNVHRGSPVRPSHTFLRAAGRRRSASRPFCDMMCRRIRDQEEDPSLFNSMMELPV
jgi:hypothetical protein